MKALQLYQRLEQDFITSTMTDDWIQYMDSVEDYLCDNFKQRSHEAHAYARQRGISILGGTHYSTEKFACQAMVKYFTKLGIPAQFIPDIPVMEDM